MASEYEILTPETVPAYIDSNPRLAGIVDTSTLEVAEVGDGNLNLVFVCRDADGNGICLKQSLPYVRLVGEGWPLTPERVIAEARGFAAAAAATPHLIPAYYGVDAERHVLAMENLMGWEIWRGKLNDGFFHRGVGAMMGEYVANLAFTTSVFALDQMEVKDRTVEAINPELCRITEDLVFTEPYIEHDNNSFVDEVAPEVAALRSDERLRAEVGMMKYKFMTAAEALIHADLHTGSVMVTTKDDGTGDARVIDPEFAYYGPVGFDLGAAVRELPRSPRPGRGAQSSRRVQALACRHRTRDVGCLRGRDAALVGHATRCDVDRGVPRVVARPDPEGRDRLRRLQGQPSGDRTREGLRH